MSEKIKIEWKRGFRHKIDPEKAYAETERIKAKNGGVLTAGMVVEKARAKRNPLHKQFEWDNDIAAEEHRLEQARTMLRSIQVVYAEAPQVAPQRVYVTTTEPPLKENPARKVYRSVDEVLEDPVARDELLGNAIRQAISFRRKYNALSELSQVFRAIDELMESVQL